jgi:hypothetical protein
MPRVVKYKGEARSQEPEARSRKTEKNATGTVKRVIDHAFQAWLWLAPHSGANRSNPRYRDRYRYRYRIEVDSNHAVHRSTSGSIADYDSDPDTDADPENVLLRLVASETNDGSPERLSPSGSHGHRPWF